MRRAACILLLALAAVHAAAAATPQLAATIVRERRTLGYVRELTELPVNLVALGDLTTRCEAGCSRDSARNGLRLAAARMGARAVVDVRCASREQGWLCVGTAADYAVDPERDARAR